MLQLYKPCLDELWFREQLLADPDTMAYNHAWGGTIPFPHDRWHIWYDQWMHADESERFYRYLLHAETSEFVGEAAYRPEDGRPMVSIIISARYRGRGFGTEALRLLCQAAKERGLTVLYDSIAADNPAVHLFLKNGFVIVNQDEEAILVQKRL